MEKTRVARLQQQIEHPALHDRIADLNGGGGRAVVEGQRGEGRAVDAVLADASADHDRQIAGPHASLPGWLAGHLGRQHAPGSAEHQRLADEARVEQEGAGHHRDPRLIAAVDDAAMDAGQHPPRMHELGGHLPLRSVRWRETEDVGVEDRLGAAAGADDVAVHPDDAGDRSAVGIQRGRRVVRLRLEAQQRPVIEPDHPGIVAENRLQEPGTVVQLRGRTTDIGVEQGHDTLGPAVLAVIDDGVEDLVLAVLGPGLRQHLELHVGERLADPAFAPARAKLGIGRVGADGGKLRRRQRQQPAVREPRQRAVVHRGHVDPLDGGSRFGGHRRVARRRPLTPLPRARGDRRNLLHQRVVQRFGQPPGRRFRAILEPEPVLAGRLQRCRGRKVIGDEPHHFAQRPAGGVVHARPAGHLDHQVGAFQGRLVDGDDGHAIRQEGHQRRALHRHALDDVDIDDPDRRDSADALGSQRRGQRRCPAIGNAGPIGDRYAHGAA